MSSDTRGGAVLEETFYIFNKKKTVYRVKLTEKGLSLQKESNGNSKTETILLDDIVGCRCMRRRRRKSESCVCRPKISSGKKNGLSVVEENSAEQDENDSSVYLYIYSYILKKNRVKSGLKRERMTITLRFRSFDGYEDNMREAQRWRVAIKCLIRNKPIPAGIMSHGEFYEPTLQVIQPMPEERRALVLLNPRSGPGRAREMFERRVAPLFTDAELAYDLHVTKEAGEARRLVRQRPDLAGTYSDIVIVAGDGLMYEVMNGIYERSDWETVCQTVSLGIIPGGSGNGLAKSISFAQGEPYNHNPVLISALNIIKGTPVPMDLVRVETKSQIAFSFLSVGWGLIADIDIESERLRSIGGQRFTVWSVARLVGLRTYRGRLSYCLAPGFRHNSAGSGPLLRRSASEHEVVSSIATNGFNGNCRSRSCHEDLGASLSLPVEKSPTPRQHRLNSATSSISEEFSVLEYEMGGQVVGETAGPDEGGSRMRLDSFYSAKSRSSAFYSVASSSFQSVIAADETGNKDQACMYGPPSRLPALTQPVPDHWTSVEGEFVMVQANYQTHLSVDCYIAPDARLDDGVIWLLVIRGGVSRSQLLQFLLGLSSGVHIHMPLVEMLPVTAFRLEPSDLKSNGHIVVDGEEMDYGPVQAEIMPGLANITSR